MIVRLIGILCCLVCIESIADVKNSNILIEQATNSIKDVEQDRIYLDSSKIHIAKDYIYLMDDYDGMIPLSAVFSSDKGVYVKSSEFMIFHMWKCNVCDYWNGDEVNICQKCHTPRGTER